MFFLSFHFCVHWGACPVGVTISTNFVFSVSAPPIRSLSRIVSSLTLCCSGLSWLGGWVVAQLSLLLVVFGGVGCSNVVVGCCSVAVCRQGAVRVAGSAILSYSLSSIDYWGLPLGLGQCAITHSYVFSYGFFCTVLNFFFCGFRGVYSASRTPNLKT